MFRLFIPLALLLITHSRSNILGIILLIQVLLVSFHLYIVVRYFATHVLFKNFFFRSLFCVMFCTFAIVLLFLLFCFVFFLHKIFLLQSMILSLFTFTSNSTVIHVFPAYQGNERIAITTILTTSVREHIYKYQF